ncbi:WH1 domain-containing protein [Balamuthia mandrillaris]
MMEQAVVSVRAGVYYFEDDEWKPVDGGLSLVQLYHDSAKDSFRVVAVSQMQKDKVVINSTVFKETTYQKASDTFHQWSDNRYAYGLNFASKQEANTFASAIYAAIEKLKVLTNNPPAGPAKSEAEDKKRKEQESEPERRSVKFGEAKSVAAEPTHEKHQSGADPLMGSTIDAKSQTEPTTKRTESSESKTVETTKTEPTTASSASTEAKASPASETAASTVPRRETVSTSTNNLNKPPASVGGGVAVRDKPLPSTSGAAQRLRRTKSFSRVQDMEVEARKEEQTRGGLSTFTKEGEKFNRLGDNRRGSKGAEDGDASTPEGSTPRGDDDDDERRRKRKERGGDRKGGSGISGRDKDRSRKDKDRSKYSSGGLKDSRDRRETTSSGSGSGIGGTPKQKPRYVMDGQEVDLGAFKRELIKQFRKEVARAKEDILDALRQELARAQPNKKS